MKDEIDYKKECENLCQVVKLVLDAYTELAKAFSLYLERVEELHSAHESNQGNQGS